MSTCRFIFFLVPAPYPISAHQWGIYNNVGSRGIAFRVETSELQKIKIRCTKKNGDYKIHGLKTLAIIKCIVIKHLLLTQTLQYPTMCSWKS